MADSNKAKGPQARKLLLDEALGKRVVTILFLAGPAHRRRLSGLGEFRGERDRKLGEGHRVVGGPPRRRDRIALGVKGVVHAVERRLEGERGSVAAARPRGVIRAAVAA